MKIKRVAARDCAGKNKPSHRLRDQSEDCGPWPGFNEELIIDGNKSLFWVAEALCPALLSERAIIISASQSCAFVKYIVLTSFDLHWLSPPRSESE